jgi:hypothetical protein
MATPRVTIDELPEQTSPVDANMLVIQDAGVTKRMSVATLRALGGSAALQAHIDNAVNAHAASAITATSSSATVDGPTVQSQLGQLATAADDVVSVPPGGSTGQILAKDSATDYDISWVDAPTGIVALTRAEYEALSPPDPDTLYVITDT